MKDNHSRTNPKRSEFGVSPEHGGEPVDPKGIPTTDPQAALKFCRELFRLLVENPDQLRGDESSDSGHAANHYDTKLLSVVIPVYNEEQNIPLLYSRLTHVLQNPSLDYEIIFVDDGSLDRSQEMLLKLTSKDPRIMVVELARNFGHQTAISAGIDHTHGTAVIVMDADLQDPPELLPEFIAKWREGYDVVYAIRQEREEGWFKRTAYAAFYRLLRRVANIDIPPDAGDFCLMNRRVADLLAGMPERNRFVRGMRSWIGLQQIGVPYKRDARNAGDSKYSFSRLILLALDGLISFSYLPLRVISLVGIGISLLSILLAGFYTIKKLIYGLSPPGFATIVVSIFFLAGVQLITIGVIGEYVGRIFDEVKHRPLYVVRKVTRNQAHANLDAK